MGIVLGGILFVILVLVMPTLVVLYLARAASCDASDAAYKAVEAARREQRCIEDVSRARKASDMVYRKGADKAYWDELVTAHRAVEFARHRFEFRDRVFPQANRRLRHLMID